jgi:drug/metabolite transporter (DMT)-like permease
MHVSLHMSTPSKSRTSGQIDTVHSALPLTAVIVAAGLHVLWGGNTVAVKLGLEAVPPMLSGFARFVIGALCIVVWGKIAGINLLPRRNEWRPLAGLGILFTVQIGLMNWGFGMTSAMMGTILLSTFTFWAAFFSLFILPGHRLTMGQVMGMVVAFAGVLIAMTRDIDFRALDLAAAGNFIVLISGALLGFRMAFAGRILRSIDPVRVTLWMMLLSLPVFGLAGALTESVLWDRLLWAPLMGLLYQGIVVAGFCFLVNYVLMQRYNPNVIISFGFIEPISGIAVAAWVLSETVSWHVGAGAGAVALGLILVTRRR